MLIKRIVFNSERRKNQLGSRNEPITGRISNRIKFGIDDDQLYQRNLVTMRHNDHNQQMYSHQFYI